MPPTFPAPTIWRCPVRCLLLLLALPFSACAEEEGWQSLFNGRDLAGWDGPPQLWAVENGVIVGQTRAPEDLRYNQFLIWRGGLVGDFELRVFMRQSGNNSGIQYRSREIKEPGPWAVAGYQLDVHPIDRNNGQLYEERGRGLIGRNGHVVVVDSEGEKWLIKELPPLETNDAEWNEYTVLACANRIEHRINGTTVFAVTDYDQDARSLEGLLAFQIHRGPPMKVEIKDVRYRPLPKETPLPFAPDVIPASTGKVPLPTTGGPVRSPHGAAQMPHLGA